MASLDRVRILVLGDSGVGKTSLVHLISQGRPLQQLSYTIGAQVEVKLHEYREGTPQQKTYWIGPGHRGLSSRRSLICSLFVSCVQSWWTWAASTRTVTRVTCSTATPTASS